MKILTRLAAVLAALAVAGPALPCGLMQQTTAETKEQPPAVAKQDPKAEKAQPPKKTTAAPKTAAVQTKSPKIARD
jgi:hypothetical protein